MSYGSEVLADGPAGYWPLGEASGLPQDSSGNARHVTSVAGTPTYGQTGAVPGITAVNFDGTTEYFSIPDGAGVDLGDVWTLEAWVIRGASGGTSRSIVGKGTGAYQLRLYPTGELNLVRPGIAELALSTIVVPSTGWHHVAGTKNGATIKLYIDGVDRTTSVVNSTCANNADALLIGANGGTPAEFFNGTIGHVAVYPTALSAARIAAHYAAASAVLPVWTAPLDTAAMSTTPTLQFTSPSSSVPQFFQIQLDTSATFVSGNLRTIDSSASVTGWSYWNGSAWVAMTNNGLPAAFSGNDVRYTVSPPLSVGTWYRRVRAGV